MRARIRAIAIIAAAGAIGLTMAGAPARAQDDVSNSVTAAQQCLCAQREVSIREREMRDARREYERARDEADALTQRVAQEHPRVNTDDRRDIEAFIALLARRDNAARTYRLENQRYTAAVSRYNDAIHQNNATCAGRAFYPGVMAAARQTLACPRY